MNLPREFIIRMQSELGNEFEAFLSVYERKPFRGVRVNTLKISVERFKEICPFSLKEIPWCKEGFYITEERAGKYLEHCAGLYYVQEPSAMCAAPMLRAEKGETVLDMCSAPGGKGTQLAQQMCGEGILFLNEINFSRAKILSQNAERLGVKNALITVSSPSDLASNYSACFDKILVDAPCSGEGMFRKEESAITEWSSDNVTMCAKRQADILSSADELLKVGGRLVYSTCTFSKDEDERQIENFLKSHKNYELEDIVKLYPHKADGEGHFAALLKKIDGEENKFISAKPSLSKEHEKLYRQFECEYLNVKFNNLCVVGETLYSLPEGAPLPKFQILRAGVRLGDFLKGRFEPAHWLAMSLKSGDAKFLELEENEAKSYIGGNTLICSKSLSGWYVAAYKGYALGWCKASGGVAKNHYPKGLRAKL